MNTIQPELLATKKHFEVLDGLRGVAAIVVVVFHFMEIVYTDYSKNFAGHGFLAVDFFFCLSGFVIAYAYGDRVGKMGIGEFLKSRLIRLHPLVILGSVLGLIGFLIFPTPNSVGKIAMVVLTSLLLIPYPVMPERYFNLFSFNAPAWSLFWEYVANILYGLFLWKLDRRILLVLLALSAAWLAFIGYKAGNLLGGWGGDTFSHGGARVAYSFLAGMLVYRFNLRIRNRLGFAGISLLLLAALLMPYFKHTWIWELGVVIIYFPLLVALGAGTVLAGRAKKICNFSGRISYPLYMTHYVVMWPFATYYAAYKPGSGMLAVIISVSTLLLIGFAWLAMVWYDEPVRKYLAARRKKQ